MRVLIGSISHETNTFSSVPTGLAAFDRYAGKEMLTEMAETRTAIGGFIAAGQEMRFEPVPVLSASATPAGKVTREAFQSLLSMLMGGIEISGKADGVLLALHGAMVTEDYDDAEGRILQEVRALVGPAVPIVATFDPHAHITALMLENANALVGYDTYPHVDSYERGKEAAGILVAMLRQSLRPTMAVKKPPMLPPMQGQMTAQPPMALLLREAQKVEKEKGVVCACVAGGFPYGDVEDAGLAVLVVTDNRPRLAEEKATRLAELAWSLRQDFLTAATPVEQAVEEAIASPEGPVILADIADNPGGGAACDGTAILRALLARGARSAVVAVIADPAAVAAAWRAGIGKSVPLLLGGKTDHFHGEPLPLTGRVRLVSDGRFVHKGPMYTGTRHCMGRTVVLECEGIEVIVTERPTQPLDRQILLSQGIDPADRKILVLKSSVAFRQDFGPLARRIIEVDGPGLTSPNLRSFPYRKVKRPIFPLDDLRCLD